MYFSACNAIDNHDRMWQSNLGLEKYWVTQSGYFRLATTVALGMGITYAKLLFSHGVPEQSKDKTISTKEYNDRTVYHCSDNHFSVDSGTPDLILPPIPIDDSPHPNKKARYTSDPLPADISVTSGKSVSTLTTPSGHPQLFEPKSDNHDVHHTIMSDKPFHGRTKRGYCSRCHGGKRYYKNRSSIAPHVQLTKGFITVMDLLEWVHS